MILFCEDCSGRNDLPFPQIEDGKAVFRCKRCNYLNKVTPPAGATKFTNFEKLVACPGIIGAFSYHTRKGLLHSHMSGPLKPGDLKMLGKRLISSYKLAYLQFPDITRLTLVIDNKNLVLHPYDPDHGLVLVCKTLPLSEEAESLIAGETGLKDKP